MTDRPSSPLWKKTKAADDWVTRFTVGDDYRWDTLLIPFDVQATRAHAWGLSHIGVLTGDEFEAVSAALDDLLEADVVVRPEDEDCHTVIEHFLTDKLGDTGKKIHTGRSRNDQVLAALRLYVREALDGISQRCAEVVRTLCSWGDELDDRLMPGYTHMQRAMPSTVGLWAMGFAELLVTDLERLRDTRKRSNVSPLGSAAGYGVPYLDLPREEIADRLGFNGIQEHVTAVQLSRGKLELDVAHTLVQVSGTLNRLASDLVLFNTSEFGFVKLPPEYCTGSSIMPQKQNPDVLELVRASYHRIAAEMQMLASLPANLPSGYHRDLQLTKECVMRAVLTAADVADALAAVLSGITFDEARLKEATTAELFATARALEMVSDGVPFREAYRQAAEEVDRIDVPTAEQALQAYRVSGYPGRCRPNVVLTRLAQIEGFGEGDASPSLPSR
ncbi:MAG: argininosuccinate lyase [Rhodothermales bacterium]